MKCTMSSHPKKMSLRAVIKSSGNDKDIELFLAAYTECTGSKFVVAEEFVCEKCYETKTFDVAQCSASTTELSCIPCTLPRSKVDAMALVASVAQQRAEIRIPASVAEKLPWLDSMPTPEFKIALLRICGVNTRSSSAEWSTSSNSNGPFSPMSNFTQSSTLDARPAPSTTSALVAIPCITGTTKSAPLNRLAESTPAPHPLLGQFIADSSNTLNKAHKTLSTSKNRRKNSAWTHSQQLRASIWDVFLESLHTGPIEVRQAAEALRDSKAKTRFLLARISELKELACCRNIDIWKVLADVFPHVFQDSADLVEALQRDDIPCIQRFMRDSKHVPTFLYIESRLRLHSACKDFSGIFRSFRLAEDWVSLPWIRKEIITTAKFALAYTEQPNMQWRAHQTCTVLLELATKVPELKPYLKKRVISLMNDALTSTNYKEELHKAISFAEVVCPEEEIMILRAKATYFDRIFKPRWAPSSHKMKSSASRGVTFGEDTIVTLQKYSDTSVSTPTRHEIPATVKRARSAGLERQQRIARACSVPLRRRSSTRSLLMSRQADDERVRYPIMTLSASPVGVPIPYVLPSPRSEEQTSSYSSSSPTDSRSASSDDNNDSSIRSNRSSAARRESASSHPARDSTGTSATSTSNTPSNARPVIPKIGSVDSAAVTTILHSPQSEELISMKPHYPTIFVDKYHIKSGLSSSTTMCPDSLDDGCSPTDFRTMSWSSPNQHSFTGDSLSPTSWAPALTKTHNFVKTTPVLSPEGEKDPTRKSLTPKPRGALGCVATPVLSPEGEKDSTRKSLTPKPRGAIGCVGVTVVSCEGQE